MGAVEVVGGGDQVLACGGDLVGELGGVVVELFFGGVEVVGQVQDGAPGGELAAPAGGGVGHACGVVDPGQVTCGEVGSVQVYRRGFPGLGRWCGAGGGAPGRGGGGGVGGVEKVQGGGEKLGGDAGCSRPRQPAVPPPRGAL